MTNHTLSLERVLSYINIEHEPKPTEGGAPPAYWPASGDLRVEKLSARYSTDGPEVLHDVSFHIKAGERVGVGEYCLRNLRYLDDYRYSLQLVVRAAEKVLSLCHFYVAFTQKERCTTTGYQRIRSTLIHYDPTLPLYLKWYVHT